MNFLVKAAVVAAALGASAVASADTFDFSYLFNDGQQQVTGSFNGTSTDGGQSVSNISNLQVTFNGNGFTGGASDQLVLNAWNPAASPPGAWVAPSAATTIFANAALNNFGISDVDQSVNSGPAYEFDFVNAPAAAAQALALNFQTGDFDLDSANGTWKLTDVAPVPVPAALPLMLSGLGLFGAALRRRNA
jgi:hypothetical protein